MKLPASYETEVYISKGGYAVIKQIGQYGEESFIFLSKEHAALVYEELECLCSIEDWTQSNEDEQKDVE